MEKTREQRRIAVAARRWVVAPAICLVLLGGVVVDRMLFHMPEGDPGPYHEHVKEAIDTIPLQIGDWVGTDQKIADAASELLKPNTILSRRYVNKKTGRWVSLLIVHCTDARDIKGHYPPVCYPSNGFQAARTGGELRTWKVGDLEIPGREYVFYSGDIAAQSAIVVMNFILRPDGEIDPDMQGLGRSAYDARLRPYGGGQVQVLFDQAVSRSERDRVFEEIVSACLPAIRTVLNGVTDE